MNEHTPESSPLPTPKYRKEEIELLIPPNICDPLNLSMPDDDLAERALISPNASTRKKRSRNRKRRRTNSASEVLDAGQYSPELKTPSLDLEIVKQASLSSVETLLTVETQVEVASSSRDFKELKLKPEPIRHGRRSEDKIVSPVVPQPGARKRNGFFPRTISKDLSNIKGLRQFTRGASKDPPDTGPSKDQTNQPTLVKNTPRFQYGNYDR